MLLTILCVVSVLLTVSTLFFVDEFFIPGLVHVVLYMFSVILIMITHTMVMKESTPRKKWTHILTILIVVVTICSRFYDQIVYGLFGWE